MANVRGCHCWITIGDETGVASIYCLGVVFADTVRYEIDHRVQNGPVVLFVDFQNRRALKSACILKLAQTIIFVGQTIKKAVWTAFSVDLGMADMRGLDGSVNNLSRWHTCSLCLYY